MWSKLAPVACVVAVGLQGCLFAEFPLAVKVAVGHACDAAADGVSEKEGLKDVAAAGGCADADATKLEELGVTSCADTLHGMLKFVLTFECEVKEASALEEVCKEASAECKEKLDSSIAEWKPEAIPDADSDKEKEEGFEAVLSIIHHCSAGSTSFVQKESDAIAKVCSDEGSAADYEAMGVGTAECPKYVTDQLVDLHTVVCVLAVLSSEDAPETPDAVTKDFITSNVDAYFAALPKDSADTAGSEADSATTARRIRLFQSIVKGKKWPGRLQQETSASKVVIFGAAALAALLAVAIGVRRRSAQQSTEHEEMQEIE